MEYRFNFNTEEEKDNLIKDNSHLTLIKIVLHLNESYLVFTDEEVIYDLTENEILGNKISILEAENEKLKVEQEQQNKDILINMLATTEMYEINRSLNISTLESDSEVKAIKKAPNYIQCTYQRLYELGIKKLEEIPFEIRINLKAK